MTPHFVGWFGKIPASGDFVVRSLPQDLQRIVHEWFANGMQELERRDPQEWMHAYLVTPVWHFVMNAGVWAEHALQGCLAPGLDKVGRYCPLIVMRTFDASSIAQMLPPANEWQYQVDANIRRTISERLAPESMLERIDIIYSQTAAAEHAQSTASILNTLGIVDEARQGHSKRWFSWPDLPQEFSERRHRSFWWAEPSPKQPPRQVIHSGKPDADLFCLLLGGDLFGHQA